MADDPSENEGKGDGNGEGTDPLKKGDGANENKGAESIEDAGEGAEGGEDDLLGQASGKKANRTAAKPDRDEILATALEKLTGALAPKMTPEQQEAAWQKLEEETGMSRKALIHQDNVARNAALMGSLEANKEIGRSKVKDIVDGDEDLMSVVEESMGTLPPQIQANPKAWADAAYMALGKAKKMGKTNQSGKADGEGGKSGQGTGRRVIAGTGTAGGARGAGGTGKGQEKAKEYPAFEQHIINRQFGGDAASYEKYKAQTHVEPEGKVMAGAGVNAADKELERLISDNT